MKVTFVCWLFMWFEFLSRLKINLEKSEMILLRDRQEGEEILIFFY